ncbi:MAG: hypothetical protein AABX04_05655 [Nanoarchaeota archaeon]
MENEVITFVAERLPLTRAEVKGSLTDREIRPFRKLKLKDSFRSHHAEFYLLRATYKSRDRPKPILIKKYVSPSGEDELAYRYQHDPSRLFAAEKANLDVISRVVSPDLVPLLYGNNDPQRAVFMEYLGRESLSHHLITEANKALADSDYQSKKKCMLIAGVKNLARFVGLCNAREEELNRVGGYYASFMSRKGAMESEEEDLFKTYLARIFYAKHPDCLSGESYRSSKVNQHLREKGIDLEDRVKALSNLRGTLNEQYWLQHGDYNVSHLFGKKVVDLEDFGYHSWTRDLSTFFMGGIDSISLPDENELPYFLSLFLAYKSAFQNGNMDKVEEIDRTVKSGENIDVNYLERMGAIDTRRQYAEFMFSFFASAIEEGIHLDATLRRYSPDHLQTLISGLEGYTIGQMQECKRVYVERLFRNLGDVSPLMNLCGNPAGERDYFFGLGQLFKDVDTISIVQDTLDRIRVPNMASSIYKALLPDESTPK